MAGIPISPQIISIWNEPVQNLVLVSEESIVNWI